MKKYKVLLAAVLTAAVFSGCARDEGVSEDSADTSTDISSAVVGESSAVQSVPDNSADSSDGVDGSSSQQTSEPSDSGAQSGDPDATFLVGLAGDTILRSELSTIFSGDGTDVSPDMFSEDNFSGVLCDGFVYLAEPTGICRTSYDNADVFDSETMRFTDISESSKKDYKRVSVGDTFCGLTLTEAQVNFARGNDSTEFVLGDGSVKTGSELGFPEIYFMGGSASFSGQLALTGYICVAPEDAQELAPGEIIFVPSDCDCMLPVMGYRFDPDIGVVHIRRMGSYNGLVWDNEYSNILLGNAANTSADLSGVPADGSFVKASVTLENIKLVCGIGMMDNCTAQIADISVLSAE